MLMKDTAKETVACIMDVLEGHGVKHVVCSPGSRNVPLLLAADARKGLLKHVVIDERAAAFMALGIGLVSQAPVALICTSGTALLNYAPAIAEAYYQGIPLIVISADRPKEWIDQDDSQTLRQYEAMRNYVKESYDLSDREQNDAGLWYVNRIANDAMLTAKRPKRGPVHINLRLSPPLDVVKEYEPGRGISARIIKEIGGDSVPPRSVIKELAATLLSKKVMVTVGFHLPDASLTKALLKLRTHPNVVIMAETISNVHVPQEENAVDSVLCGLRDATLRKRMRPDVVISIGGALVSRMLKEFLRPGDSSRPEHWSIGPAHTTVDCFQSLSLRIDADPGLFISQLSGEMTHQKRLMQRHPENMVPATADGMTQAAEYGATFRNLRKDAMARIKEAARSGKWSELSAFHTLLTHLPANFNLFLSNGTAIRYAQIIPHLTPHASYCNRGVSGIEGSTSTSVGGAVANQGSRPTMLITGDMSFAHDLGGLALAKTLDAAITIVVMNNAGGGIFRFIDSTSGLYCREEYLCADPGLNIKEVAESFGFEYLLADDKKSLDRAISRIWEIRALHARIIVEVKVPPIESAEILKALLRPEDDNQNLK